MLCTGHDKIGCALGPGDYRITRQNPANTRHKDQKGGGGGVNKIQCTGRRKWKQQEGKQKQTNRKTQRTVVLITVQQPSNNRRAWYWFSSLARSGQPVARVHHHTAVLFFARLCADRETTPALSAYAPQQGVVLRPISCHCLTHHGRINSRFAHGYPICHGDEVPMTMFFCCVLSTALKMTLNWSGARTQPCREPTITSNQTASIKPFCYP